MSLPATIGLAIIARDEEAMLPGLLASASGAFDQVALLDSGSTDRTVEVFESWAADQQLALGYEVGSFEWCDDFAAAHERADSLLGTSWVCNADADDEIRGARNLRAIAASVPAEVAAVAFAWDVFDGGVTWRTRLARQGASRWSGRVHETLLADGPVLNCHPMTASWFHRRRDERPGAGARYLHIAQHWARERPDDPRALCTVASEEFGHGDQAEAVRYARAYLALPRVRRELGDAAHADALAALDRLAVLDRLPATEPGAWEQWEQLAAALGYRPPQSWA